MKLLIVEDNPAVRRLLRSIVQPFADEISECDGGREALAIYSAHNPDLVLMDIVLKVSDGLETTRQIIALNPAARVVIVTNFDAEDLRDEARDAGACGFVLKENLPELVNFF
jgi:two-component system response regulator DegU